MRLSPQTCSLLRNLIADLYTHPFEEPLVAEVVRRVAAITESQYASFCVFDENSMPKMTSNNPPEFLQAYLPVRDRDFLQESIVDTGSPYVLRRAPDWNAPSHQDFIHAVQEARPIADVVYVPVKVAGRFHGHFAQARAEEDGRFYTTSDIELFSFIASFINDAFQRSFLPPPAADELAYFDHAGHLVYAGARIKDVFDSLFGGNTDRPSGSHAYRLQAFRDGFQGFLRNPFRIGMEKLTLSSGGVRHRFSLGLFSRMGIAIRQNGVPYVTVRLLSSMPDRAALKPGTPPPGSGLRFRFSARERQIIDGIYQAKSNKQIAFEMGVEESTVKRYSHNIYEKTGFASRVELVLGLGGQY